MTTFMQVLKGVIWTFIGILLGYVTVYKIGNAIFEIFAGESAALMAIFKIIQFILMAVIVFIVPLMFMRNPEVMDNILNKFDKQTR